MKNNAERIDRTNIDKWIYTAVELSEVVGSSEHLLSLQEENNKIIAKNNNDKPTFLGNTACFSLENQWLHESSKKLQSMQQWFRFHTYFYLVPYVTIGHILVQVWWPIVQYK